MPPPLPSQRHRALALLEEKGMARLAELTGAGVTAATVSRLEREGAVVRLARGLYQLPDASIDAHHTLAEAAKLAPKGVVCLTSALDFYDLTDQLPPKVWMAIGPKDWRPRFSYPPVRFVRFPEPQLHSGVGHHVVDGIEVPIFGIAKTIADLFRYRRAVGINLAVEGLREALRQRKATPSAIAKCAVERGVWKIMEPYLTAMSSNG